jgi:signal transduction histidine kinase
LAFIIVALLIIRIDTNIWHEQARLQEQFAAIKAEKFYFGVNFRVNVRKLNATLLEFQQTGRSEDLDLFRQEAGELKAWLLAKEGSFVAPGEREKFKRLELAADEFLAAVEPLLQRSIAKSGSEGFVAAYAQIRRDSQPLLTACDEVVNEEHGEFDLLLHDSDRTLLSLQRFFLGSQFLLVVLAAALAILVYRGMIAPLRAQLVESQVLLARQEKLASLGALGAGVAHEIRNPLQAIKFRLFSLKGSLPAEFADNEDARVISDELNRLDRIVKDFLQFARPSQPELVLVPAERMLYAVHDLLKSQLEKTAILLELEIRQPAWVAADTQQIEQVLNNLIQNAADSIEKNGSITLRLDRSTAEFGRIVRPAAILSVTDTGNGISPQIQDRLFDPFFTTRDDGTGLGLAIAARIVEQHGGLLRYRTEVNRGTTFEIVLPRTENHDAT